MTTQKDSAFSYALVLGLGVGLAACGQAATPQEEETPVEQTAPPPIEPRASEEQVQYTVRVPTPHTHYLEVEAVFPSEQSELEVWMASWTPGSYMIREYARHIEDLSATTLAGSALEVEKTRKNRWRIASGEEAQVVVRYKLYCRELSVRTNFVDADLAMLNGAPTFLTADSVVDAQIDLHFEFPEGWTVHTGLAPGGDTGRYLSRNYDELVDTPVVAGQVVAHEFEIDGTPHVFANFGQDELWDQERMAPDVEAITRTQIEFWQTIPYDRYVYLNVLTESGGGLEHRNSTLMLGSAFATRNDDDYFDWLGLVSHEFFHTWNIKQLRPAALGPFDYDVEVYTEDLWVVEGLTSYYDDLLLLRAGIFDEQEYLKRLSKQIDSVQTTPGRLVQPLSRSSFDAWIKFYRWDENSPNSSISYYRKGAVVGFLLDAEIRAQTGSARSLDDVMRLAYERHSGETGYTSEEFRAAAAEVTGAPLDEFFAKYVDGTDELDFTRALDLYGLRFGEADSPDDPPGTLEIEVDGRGMVTGVRRGGPGHEAGVNVEDEILAIDGRRVRPGGLSERLGFYRPGDSVTLLVARRSRLRELPVVLGGAEPTPNYELEILDPGTPPQVDARSAWLSVPPSEDE
ncbi:MAG: PDZ domain-containing protein [Myxococcota bacterium]